MRSERLWKKFAPYIQEDSSQSLSDREGMIGEQSSVSILFKKRQDHPNLSGRLPAVIVHF